MLRMFNVYRLIILLVLSVFLIQLNGQCPNPVPLSFSFEEASGNTAISKINSTLISLINTPSFSLSKSEGFVNEGMHEITWKTEDSFSHNLRNGLYFTRLSSSKRVICEKIIIQY